MFSFFKRKRKEKETLEYQILENVETKDVIYALREWGKNKPKGVYRTILVKEDNSIDFQELKGILGGIPKENFYMSKATYEVFPEIEKNIPFWLDVVQDVVDGYISTEKSLPVIDFCPDGRINYFLLTSKKYLKEEPPMVLYLKKDKEFNDYMVSHKK